jgi:hypothetical protein
MADEKIISCILEVFEIEKEDPIPVTIDESGVLISTDEASS